jgi:lipopolysaccharide export system permease protein
MITLFDRYIGRTVLLGIVAVLALLLVLIGFFELVAELEEVKAGYTTSMAYTYVLLGMPRYCYELFPLATLLGSLIGLGVLAGNSELLAMRAAGVSIARIVLAVLKTGLMVLLLVVIVGEYLAPVAEQQAQRMKNEALSGQISLKTRYGFWSRDGNTFINIRQILPDSQLADISIYEYGEDARLRRAIHAERARFQSDGWVIQGVEQSDFSGSGVSVASSPDQAWQVDLDPSALDVLTVKPHMLAAWDLWRYIDYLQNNGQASIKYEVAFWGKLATPLVTMLMLFLSVPFVFGSLRSVGVGQRIFVGALLGITFYLLNRTFAYMAVVYSLNGLFAAFFPLLLFLLLAIGLLRRVN